MILLVFKRLRLKRLCINAVENSKQMAYEKEWRCIKIFDEEDLDCGEDQDWYMDESFATESLGAVYFGFRMPDYEVREIAQRLQTTPVPTCTCQSEWMNTLILSSRRSISKI